MKKIYLLQVMFYFNNYEYHYENAYSSLELAKQTGEKWLEDGLRKEYDDWFDEEMDGDIPREKLSKEQLFKLKATYDFKITEFDPDYIDKLNNMENLPIVTNFDIYDTYSADLEPSKIEHSYDYNGEETYITGIYIFNYKGKRIERKIGTDFADYINPLAGTKFKKGDIVTIKENYYRKLGNYPFYDKLHVITGTPQKNNNQKFFRNYYNVIINHNFCDEGCHVDCFEEEVLELYTGELPKDSPIIFLSKYFKGEIKLQNISWLDIECGRIALNENKSFREVPEIMEQLKGENTK